MLDPIVTAVLFVIYMIFLIITVEVYRQKGQIDNLFLIPSIYLFYTILIAYVIGFMDVDGNIFEKAVQTLIFAFTAGIVMLINYRDKIVSKEDTNLFQN